MITIKWTGDKLVITLIPICTSGKDVDILATHTLTRGNGTAGHITWFNPPKPVWFTVHQRVE